MIKSTGRICENCGKEIFDGGPLTENESEIFERISVSIGNAESLADPRKFPSYVVDVDKDTLNSFFETAIKNLNEVRIEFNEIIQKLAADHGFKKDGKAFINFDETTGGYSLFHCGS
jgi:hypothetical protein